MKIQTEKSAGSAKPAVEPPPSTASRPEATEICFAVNPPFRGKPYASTKKLDPDTLNRLEKTIGQDEQLLFVIVGDLNIQSRYAKSVLAVTDKLIYGFDDTFEGGVRTERYENVKRAFVKRYYSNAVLVLSSDDSGSEHADVTKGYTNFIRFSYKVAALYDAAATFIEHVAAGKSIEEEMGGIEVTFEHQFCVCPQCGRNLIRPGAPCMNCQGKAKLVKTLVKYLLPHWKMLIFCLLLSLMTTAVSLLPPYMTQTLVDDVFPNGDKSLLVTCVLGLLFANLIQYGIGALRGIKLNEVGLRLVTELRNDVYSKALHLPMQFFDRTSTGSVVNRINGDTGNLQAFMLRVTQEVVVQVFLLIGIAFIMLTMNWQLTLLSLVPVPFVVWGSRVFGKKIRPFHRRVSRR